jgi:hypothetical protein
MRRPMWKHSFLRRLRCYTSVATRAYNIRAASEREKPPATTRKQPKDPIFPWLKLAEIGSDFGE